MGDHAVLAAPTPGTHGAVTGGRGVLSGTEAASLHISSFLPVADQDRCFAYVSGKGAHLQRPWPAPRAPASSLAAGPPSPSRKVSLVPDRLWESLSKLHEHRHECNERPEEPKEHAAVHGGLSTIRQGTSSTAVSMSTRPAGA